MKRPPHEQLNELFESLRKAGTTSAQPDRAFVTKLEQRLHAKMEHKHATAPRLWSMLFLRPLIPVSALVVVVLAVTLIAVWNRPGTLHNGFRPLSINAASAEENFTLTPTKQDAAGVASDSHFILTSKIDLTLADVRAAITVSPELTLRITEKSAREFELIPAQPLTAGVVYQFSLGATVQTSNGSVLRHFNWAYQAKNEVQIEGALPRNQATSVPVDTGIELTLNTSQIDSLDGHFTISPAVHGRFEHHGHVIAFVPEQHLAFGTLYTVTIQKGLTIPKTDATLTTDYTVQFETAAEASTSNQWYGAHFSDSFTSVKPDEPPQINYGAYSNPGTTVNLSATVYKFTDAQDLITHLKPIDALPRWAYTSRSTATISTDGLQKVGDYPLAQQNSLYTFPQGFAAGYYLVDITQDGHHLQSPLVVTPLEASLTTTQTQSALWLYDLTTKQPVAHATLQESIASQNGTTDANGLATFSTPDALKTYGGVPTRGYVVVKAGNRETVVPETSQAGSFGFGIGIFRSQAGNNITPSGLDYWTYMWTDRTLYRPTDMVNVWGVVKPRDGKTSALEVTLTIKSTQYINDNTIDVVAAQQTVKTNAYGSYTVSLPLKALQAGFYSVTETVDGKDIANRSFEVRTFTKPAYQIIVTPSALAVVDGATVTYDIRTEFFDGTPAPHVNLHYGGYGHAGDAGESITTDEQGHASFNSVRAYGGDRHYPSSDTLSFWPAESAEGDIAASTTVTVYPSAVTLDATSTRTGDSVQISATVSTIDFTKVQEVWGDTPTKDPVPNSPVSGTVYEQVVTKTKVGTIYDSIEKKTVDQYSYSWNNVQRQTFTGTTDKNGKYTTTLTLTGDNAYLIDVAAKDSKGRTVVRTLYTSKYDQNARGSDVTTFSVRDQQALGAANSTIQPKKYRIGDATNIAFLQNGVEAPSEGQFLFLKLQNGLRDTSVTKKSVLPVTFADADAPNVYYTAIWFDGTAFRDTNIWDAAQLVFDQESRRLTITVTGEKTSYAPGEKATLDVHVTDEDGKGTQAEVSLSAIDAALASIETENPPAVLEGLYTSLPTGIIQTYISAAPLNVESGAEGGGGGDGPRRDFKDAALFTQVETNGNGDAHVTFTVPDNITSWRVTTQAVTKNLYAGNAISSIAVTKPIFGLLTMPDSFVVADQPVILGRAYGASLKSSDDVQLTLDIADLHEHDVQTKKAFAETRFTLPKLTVGTHDVQFTVQRGKSTDTLIRTITVLPSRLTRFTSAYTDVHTGQQWTPTADRSTIVFSDAGRSRVLQSLHDLAWAYGKRVERYMAANIAMTTLKQLNDPMVPMDVGFDATQYQQIDGGISQVVYGDSDLYTSALAASNVQLFDRARLRNYFVTKLENKKATRDQIGMSLLGLAYLKEPVLGDLDAFLALDGITPENRLTAALAYHAIGADDKARTLTHALLKDYGETQDPYIRLKIGKDDDANIVATAQFSILTEGLQFDERFGIERYLGDHFPKATITNLERALALQEAAGVVSDAPVSIRYSVSGKEATADLSSGKQQALSLTADELRTLSILDVQGSVGAVTYSTVPVDVSKEKVDTRLQVGRSYSAVGHNGPFVEGDIVRIGLNPKAGAGILDSSFFVTDSLPSGFVLLANPWNHYLDVNSEYAYTIAVDGQQVTLYADGKHGLYYYARVLIPGSYAAEPALMQGQTSRDTFNYSGGQTITIQ